MGSCNSTFQLLLRLIFLLLLTKPLFLEALGSDSDAGNFSIGCIEIEWEALLKFKEGLKDLSGQLSSWVGDDCCNWAGVGCSNQTSHVLKLDLRSPRHCLFPIFEINKSCLKGGTLNPSLLNLTYLNYLDLGRTSFQGAPIPEFIGSLKNLRYLDLSEASFDGVVPLSLGNLSNLRYLDLSFSSPKKLWVSDLNWLSGLSSLQYLRLGAVDLSKVTTNWLQVVNTLPILLELRMPFCDLQNTSHSLPFVNLTSLSILDLSGNNFQGSPILEFIGSLKNLRYLDLSDNNFQGSPIPEFIGLLKNLRYLDLSNASFDGVVPLSLGNLSNLRYLDLTTFSYPQMLWVSELNWLSGLSSLQYLHLGGVNLSKATNNWPQVVNMLPSLLELKLTSCELDNFPQSLPFVNFTSLSVLDLSANKFNSPIPQWLFNISTLLNLALGSSHLSGSIPKVPRGNLCNLRALDLSLNDLSGEIEEFIETLSGCNNSTLEELVLSSNKLVGNVPESFGYFQVFVLSSTLPQFFLGSATNIYRKFVIFDYD